MMKLTLESNVRIRIDSNGLYSNGRRLACFGSKVKRCAPFADARLRLWTVCENDRSEAILEVCQGEGGQQVTRYSLSQCSRIWRESIDGNGHCLLLNVDAGVDVHLATDSETDCQRWTSGLLDALFSADRIFGQALVLSSYPCSIIDLDVAGDQGLDRFEYWAVIDRSIGFKMFPRRTRTAGGSSQSICFSFDRVADIRLKSTDKQIDNGRIFEIDLKTDIPNETHQSKKMKKKTQRSKNKEVSATAFLGISTLSIFCPEAQKLVDEWRRLSAEVKPAAVDQHIDVNGNRCSTSGSTSGSTPPVVGVVAPAIATGASSGGNLTAIGQFLRRSLPSLVSNQVNQPPLSSANGQTGNPASTGGGGSTTSPPPLPSRRQLEERENERLVERQLRKNRLGEQSPPGQQQPHRQSSASSASSTSSSSSSSTTMAGETPAPDAHYKLLSGEVFPVLKSTPDSPSTPPPLPPRCGQQPPPPPQQQQQQRPTTPEANYKLLPASGVDLYASLASASAAPPPFLPPRRGRTSSLSDRKQLRVNTGQSVQIDQYKTLNAVLATPRLCYNGAGGHLNNNNNNNNNCRSDSPSGYKTLSFFPPDEQTPKPSAAASDYAKGYSVLSGLSRPSKLFNWATRRSLETEV